MKWKIFGEFNEMRNNYCFMLHLCNNLL
jgi:hypothetical protein